MGLRRVLQGLFTGSAQAPESYGDALIGLTKSVMRLGEQLEQLEQAQSATQVALRRFQGRVYAWKGWESLKEEPEKPAERPLNDPGLSKQELRARLLQPGKPFKHN